MIFFKASIHKDQSCADFEWPGKVTLNEAELNAFIAKLLQVRRQLLPGAIHSRKDTAHADIKQLQ